MFTRSSFSTAVRSDKGFTLVELLVTVTIIGILASVVTFGVSGATTSSQNKANQGQLNSHQTAIDAWFGTNPLQDPAASAVGTSITTGTDQSALSARWYTVTGIPLVTAAALSTVGGYSAGDYREIDRSKTTKDATGAAFNTFFRVNNASAKCYLAITAASTVFACQNP